jgi:hypothetical protein
VLKNYSEGVLVNSLFSSDNGRLSFSRFGLDGFSLRIYWTKKRFSKRIKKEVDQGIGFLVFGY